MKKTLFLILLLFVAAASHAAQTGWGYAIKSLSSNGGDPVFQIDDTWTSGLGCTGANADEYFVLEAAQGDFDVQFSLLVLAYATNSDVGIQSIACSNEWSAQQVPESAAVNIRK